MIPITARTETNVAKWIEACGNMLRLNRSSPYVPTLSKTPARSTEPAVGASVCASGSQVCSGNSGTFTANATKNARKIERAERTEHRALEDQDGHHVAGDVRLDLPRSEDGDREQEGRQQHEPETDPIDPDEVLEAERPDPPRPVDHLVAGCPRLEVAQDEKGDAERGERREQREDARVAVVDPSTHHSDQRCPHEREQDREREEVLPHD